MSRTARPVLAGSFGDPRGLPISAGSAFHLSNLLRNTPCLSFRGALGGTKNLALLVLQREIPRCARNDTAGERFSTNCENSNRTACENNSQRSAWLGALNITKGRRDLRFRDVASEAHLADTLRQHPANLSADRFFILRQ